MRRRELLTLLGGAAATPMLRPFAARAQQSMPVIGILYQGSAAAYAPILDLVRQGLKNTGFVEDQNVKIEYRWADGQYDQLPAMAEDLVRHRVDVIAASLLPAAQAAKAATKTIPIVFEIGSDPVQVGLVSSMSRPGGNLTGMTRLNVELGPKRLEVLREVVPAARVVGFVVNPTNPNAEATMRDAQQAAHLLGLQLQVFAASTESGINAAFATMVQQHADALLVGPDAFFSSNARQFASLAARHAIPAIYTSRRYAAAGGLMSYGASFADIDPQVGAYIGRILKGEKPADLPVQQAAKVEFVINLKTAKALGITVPITLLGRADEVIE